MGFHTAGFTARSKMEEFWATAFFFFFFFLTATLRESENKQNIASKTQVNTPGDDVGGDDRWRAG